MAAQWFLQGNLLDPGPFDQLFLLKDQKVNIKIFAGQTPDALRIYWSYFPGYMYGNMYEKSCLYGYKDQKTKVDL